ncbi:MAG: hypothetical protein RQ751_02440 [Longimicrobiales bacterium]|nr:hypothetical protein [Longimicrobiales bacterium]
MDFTRSRTVEFFDAQGVQQAAWDDFTTASVHTVLEVAGEMGRPGFEWSMDRTRDMWVTGLEGVETERTRSGTGSGGSQPGAGAGGGRDPHLRPLRNPHRGGCGARGAPK